MIRQYWNQLTDANQRHLAGLDHLRALAILLVFLCHYRAYPRPDWVNEIGLFGWTGVDLFFVLSGYLIGNQLMQQLKTRQTIGFSTFYLNRALRIFPAYFVVVLLYFAFPVIRERDGIAPWWQFLTFTQNFDLDFGNEATFSHAWSLCIEEQFYLLLPVSLALVMRTGASKRGIWVFLGIFLMGLLLRGINWMYFMSPFYEGGITDGRFVTYNKWVYYPTYNRLDGLTVGVAVAAIMNYRPQWRTWQATRGNQLLMIGLILLTGAFFLMRGDRLDFWPTLLGYPLLSLAYGVMVFAALSPSCVLYRFRWKGSTVIAAWSYGMYLCHKFLNHLMQGPLDAWELPEAGSLRVLICLAVTLIGAALLNFLVEYPFMRLRRRLNKA